eukprot:COSAG06_NODE_1941_length_8015_cov_2.703007_5_plen_87_part_00
MRGVALDRHGKLRYRISSTSSAAATAAGGGHSAAAAAAGVGAGTDDETEGWVRHAPIESHYDHVITERQLLLHRRCCVPTKLAQQC